jgi:hypothetical protein
MLSLFLRSSTNCGSNNGLSFGDIFANFWVIYRREGYVDAISIASLYSGQWHFV